MNTGADQWGGSLPVVLREGRRDSMMPWPERMPTPSPALAEGPRNRMGELTRAGEGLERGAGSSSASSASSGVEQPAEAAAGRFLIFTVFTGGRCPAAGRCRGCRACLPWCLS